jgi:hypothetical protein
MLFAIVFILFIEFETFNTSKILLDTVSTSLIFTAVVFILSILDEAITTLLILLETLFTLSILLDIELNESISKF